MAQLCQKRRSDDRLEGQPATEKDTAADEHAITISESAEQTSDDLYPSRQSTTIVRLVLGIRLNPNAPTELIRPAKALCAQNAQKAMLL